VGINKKIPGSLEKSNGLYPIKRTVKKGTSCCRMETTAGGSFDGKEGIPKLKF